MCNSVSCSCFFALCKVDALALDSKNTKRLSLSNAKIINDLQYIIQLNTNFVILI